MPFKHNAPRRHHIPRARYRVTNWPMYEAGLRRRGDLTLWLDEAALTGWAAPKRSSPGGQPLYSGLAIELVLTLRLVFHLALRQAEAFSRSVLRLLGLALSVFRTIARSAGADGRLQGGSRVSGPRTARSTSCWIAWAWNCLDKASGMPRSTAERGGIGASFISLLTPIRARSPPIC